MIKTLLRKNTGFCFFVFFLLVIFLFLIFAGRFLLTGQAPIKSDVVILLTGGGPERLFKSVELYKKGYAPVLIISNAMEDNLYNSAIQLGIPEENILKETKADSTYKNALYTFQIMKEHKFRSAIVVSSDYHMRRVKFNFDRVYNHSGIRLTFCAAKSNYNPTFWFTNESDIRTTFNEYVKLVGNALGLNGTEDKKPLYKINNLFF